VIKTGSATILSSTARFVGEMTTDEEVILAGTFEGVLRTSRSVQVTTTGTVNGEVHAESVTILGRVLGPVHAVDRIELRGGAHVDGDLAARSVRIHDDVFFNGHCRVTGPEAARRQYLVPGLVQAFDIDPSSQALGGIERAAETFLRDFGFEVELRPDHATDGVLRPIFRSRDALPYSHLREKLRFVEHALQTAASPEPRRERRFAGLSRRRDDEPPLQTTGADGARALVEALGSLHNVALMLGPVIVTRFEEERGPRLSVRVRDDSLPGENLAPDPPDPSQLLVSLQKVQTEVVRDLSASAPARRSGA
jgi:cytoskeletal protein CcmA (bactofilin family)